MKALLPLMLVVALGCQSAGVPPVPRDAPPTPEAPDGLGEAPGTPGVLQASLEVGTVPATEARLTQVLSVKADVVLKNAAVGSEVAVEFLTPDGAMWMRKQATVTQPQSTLSFELPIAGTLVQDHGLSGNWRVRTELDGVELAVREVSLQP